MYRITAATCPELPEAKPRYLMGVGRPIDLLESVARGIDLFDCVMPTRNGRNALAFTASGQLKLRNASHRERHTSVGKWTVPASPAVIPAATCGICSWPAKCWVRFCCRSTI